MKLPIEKLNLFLASVLWDLENRTVDIPEPILREVFHNILLGMTEGIVCYEDGSIEIEGHLIDLTPSERTILKRICPMGFAPRLDVLNEVIPISRQMKMKNPEKTMYTHICNLNGMLRNFNLKIETDKIFYFLRRFSPSSRLVQES